MCTVRVGTKRPLVRKLRMKRGSRFLERIYALVASPMFADMEPAKRLTEATLMGTYQR